jgi:tellurite resistance-related uncharacterized protein
MALSLPANVQRYAQTKEFTQDTVPAALLKDHSTKPEAWGLIVVSEGALIYTRINQQPERIEAGNAGVIVPHELHKVAPDGVVRFHVEFYRETTTAPSGA